MRPVEVREAASADLDAVLELYVQLAEDRPESQPVRRPEAEGLFTTVTAQPGRTLLVAVAGDAIVGTADLAIVSNLTHHGMPWAIVENVVVDNAQRRAGVGRALMDEIVSRCRHAGCYKIQLLSRKHRRSAHVFYESLGFERSAEGFRLYLL
jgi:ribosomal protein S18 acetylase RimI-like enzyme